MESKRNLIRVERKIYQVEKGGAKYMVGGWAMKDLYKITDIVLDTNDYDLRGYSTITIYIDVDGETKAWRCYNASFCDITYDYK